MQGRPGRLGRQAGQACWPLRPKVAHGVTANRAGRDGRPLHRTPGATPQRAGPAGLVGRPLGGPGRTCRRPLHVCTQPPQPGLARSPPPRATPARHHCVSPHAGLPGGAAQQGPAAHRTPARPRPATHTHSTPGWDPKFSNGASTNYAAWWSLIGGVTPPPSSPSSTSDSDQVFLHDFSMPIDTNKEDDEMSVCEADSRLCPDSAGLVCLRSIMQEEGESN